MSEEREAFVLAAAQEGANISALCRQFEVSRDTGYRWLAYYHQEGKAGLKDHSRRPRLSPRQTSPEVEALVCDLRRQHPAWGGRKIHHRLEALGHPEVPAPSTITGILDRNGLLSPDRRKQRDWQRFEAESANRMWQMDFKGDFATGQGRCHILTVLDDHSRYNLCLAACENQRTETVRSHLMGVFQAYGLPEILLVDNGPPWGSGWSRQPHTRFSAELIQWGISVWHGRPYHPQTRGKDERFHRSLKDEVIQSQASWPDHASVQCCLTPWQVVYNQERPHESLGYAVPASRYLVSPRALPPVEYSASDVVRRVQVGGKISFRGRELRIGKAFGGKPVALRAVDDGSWDVYFCHQRIGSVDLRSPPDEL